MTMKKKKIILFLKIKNKTDERPVASIKIDTEKCSIY